MIKYVAGDIVRVTREGHYCLVRESGVIQERRAHLVKGVEVVLKVERNWPPDGWWIAKWSHNDILINEGSFELLSILEMMARAAAESWEL